MRFEKRPKLPGAGRTRARHYHGTHSPTSPKAVLLGKMAHHTKQIRWECMTYFMFVLLRPRSNERKQFQRKEGPLIFTQ